MTQCLMIVFTGIIALAAIAQFMVSKWQRDVMQGQLDEMQSASTQGKELVQQTKENDNAAKDAATAARLSAESLINSELQVSSQMPLAQQQER